jgi:threonine aldolase
VQIKVIDLRSDTVTRPTPEMFAAMASAPLGDDVLGDEPTVAELELEAAKLLGMEAAVFVPSGTMGNQIALACHTNRGDAVLFEEQAHMLFYEVGAPAVIAQVLTKSVPSHFGIMELTEIESRIEPGSLHTPATTLLCLENTHNRAGGTVISVEQHKAYFELAKSHGLNVHLDGARMFNACTALGVEPSEIGRYVDSVSICLSKGLGAPVGSVLCGGAEFIQRARIWRKRLGGGMRQSGILAACGLVGLRTIRHQLIQDHQKARRIAEALVQVPGATVNLDEQATNFVMIDTVKPAAEVCTLAKEKGLLCMPFGKHRVRLVTHYDIREEDIQPAIEILSSAMRA